MQRRYDDLCLVLLFADILHMRYKRIQRLPRRDQLPIVWWSIGGGVTCRWRCQQSNPVLLPAIVEVDLFLERTERAGCAAVLALAVHVGTG